MPALPEVLLVLGLLAEALRVLPDAGGTAMEGRAVRAVLAAAEGEGRGDPEVSSAGNSRGVNSRGVVDANFHRASELLA